MNRLAGSPLFVVLYLIFFNGVVGASDTLNFKGQLSFNYSGSEASTNWQNQTTLRYIPDLTIQQIISDDYSWDLNLSANSYANYQNYPESDFSSAASLYRFNAQLKTAQSDTTLGLQKINFGPALILRSLRWFDQVNPTDPLKLTEGVTGIRYRYFFMNNANIWLWALYGNSETKGYEIVATKEDTPEVGARFQYPLESGEMGFSFHIRKTERLGFSDISVGEDLWEKRLALDGKWDLGPGVWYEYVVIDQGADAHVNTNWFSMLTLGADYTFAIGNGLHILTEHLAGSISDRAAAWDSIAQTSALQFSYPVGILDAVSLMEIYSWRQKQGTHYLRWNRTYDDWSFSLGAFIAPEQSSNEIDMGLSGTGIQSVIVYNH